MTFYPRGSHSALFNSLNPEFKAMVYTKHVSVARVKILLQPFRCKKLITFQGCKINVLMIMRILRFTLPTITPGNLILGCCIQVVLYCLAKPKGSICLLLKYANIAVWLCRTELWRVFVCKRWGAWC